MSMAAIWLQSYRGHRDRSSTTRNCNAHCLQYASWRWDLINDGDSILEDGGSVLNTNRNQVMILVVLDKTPTHQK